MRLPKAALAVPAAFIMLALPVIDFPATTAVALGGGLAIVAAIVSKMAAQDVEFLLSRDRLLSIATVMDLQHRTGAVTGLCALVVPANLRFQCFLK